MNDPDDRFCSGCGGPLEDPVAAGPSPVAARPVQAQPGAYPPVAPPAPGYQPAAPVAPPVPGYQPAPPAPGYAGQYQGAPQQPPQGYQQPVPGYQPAAPGYQQPAPGYQQPAAAYMPQAPQPYPYPAAPPKKRGWVKWGSIISSVLVVLVGVLKLLTLFGGDSSGSYSTVATGSLAVQPEYYDSIGQFFVSGQGTTATFYTFDDKGAAKQLATVNDAAAGKLLGVAVGDLYNNGNAAMVAYYEKKLYIAGQTGKSDFINAAITNAFIGDFDGDGKQETIFVDKGKDGKDEYQLWRFSAKQDESKELITLGGRTLPKLNDAKIRVGNKDYLLGYTNDNGLAMVLYSWDNIGGFSPWHSYAIKDTKDQPAEWIAAGAMKQGQALLVSYGGSKPIVEIRMLSKDGSDAKSLGTITAEGQGSPAIAVGNFAGKDPAILAVDQQGKYFIYSLK